MRELAGRLIAYETRGKKWARLPSAATFFVGEKLRPPLATLLGHGGFQALHARALALAGAEIPWLRAVRIQVDGSLEGLDELAAKMDRADLAEGRLVLLAQLLGLLVAFIGEIMTLQLVREVWPRLSLHRFEFGVRRSSQ